MGAWGIKTFENDGALDWLDGFLKAPSERRILEAFSAEPVPVKPGFFGKMLGKPSTTVPRELDGEDVLAAAEVVATILGRPAGSTPDELKDPLTIVLSPDTASKAVAAINAIMKDSDLKSCWEETDDFEAWKAEVQSLKARLS